MDTITTWRGSGVEDGEGTSAVGAVGEPPPHPARKRRIGKMR
jgi:hypothetical protein